MENRAGSDFKAQPPGRTSLLASIFMVFFAFGFCSIIVQTTLVREFLVVFSGNELCLGMVFGIWLFWIGVGAALGSWISHRTKRPGLLFAMLAVGLSVTPVGQIYAIRLVRAFYNLEMGLLLSFGQMAKFALVCLAPFALMVGLTFPLGCRVLERQRGTDPVGIGWIYVVESAGFLVGGVVFTFVLVTHGHYAPFANAAIGFGMVSLACFISDLGCFSKKSRLLGIAVTIAATAVFLAFSGRIDRRSVQERWDALKVNLELKRSVDSRYENLAVGYSNEQYTVFGSGSPMFAFPDEYTYAPVANSVLSEHPNPKSVLLIGNGSQGLIREFLANPIESLWHVELDPMMTEVVLPFLPEPDKKALHDPRLHRAHGDGRLFVKTAKEKFDVVFINIPDPSTAMLNRYYTKDFYEEVKRILNPGGVVAARMSSAAAYIGEDVGDYAGSIYHTFSDVFGNVVINPGEHNYLFGSPQPGVVTDNFEVLGKRYKERGVESQYFSEYNFMLLFPQPKTKWWRQQLEERSGRKRNTDLQPISYFYNLLMWDHFSGSHLRGLFRKVEKLKLRTVAAVLAALVFLRLAYSFVFRRRFAARVKFNCLLSMAVCGFSVMVFDITLIFGFQNLYGYLYHMIGLISALFMFGLAIGGIFTNIVLKRKKAGLRAVFAVHVALIVYALVLPLCMKLLSSGPLSTLSVQKSQPFFVFLVVMAGILGGVEFPLVSSVFFQHSRRTGVTAGLVDGSDHLGACLGAVLSGTIFVPIIGLAETCYIVAMASIACVVLIGILMLQEKRH